MRAPRSRLRPLGQPLIAPGASVAPLTYNPTWCGREVCGPPPPPPKTVVTMHLGPPKPPTATAPLPPAIVMPPSPPVLAPPPVRSAAPPLVMTTSVTEPTTCACSWWKIAAAGLAGFALTFYAQSKKKDQKRQRNAAGALSVRVLSRSMGL